MYYEWSIKNYEITYEQMTSLLELTRPSNPAECFISATLGDIHLIVYNEVAKQAVKSIIGDELFSKGLDDSDSGFWRFSSPDCLFKLVVTLA